MPILALLPILCVLRKTRIRLTQMTQNVLISHQGQIQFLGIRKTVQSLKPIQVVLRRSSNWFGAFRNITQQH